MDLAVKQAMLRWPNVPDCHGWLHLTAQGHWLLGEYNSTHPPARIEHEGLKQFISRNYLCPFPSKSLLENEGLTHPAYQGAWAMQNGPQKVWVSLATAPWVVHLSNQVWTTHTGLTLMPSHLYLSSDGLVYGASELGPFAIASQSMDAFSQGISESSAGLIWQASPRDTAIGSIYSDKPNANPPLNIELCDHSLIAKTLQFKREPSH